MRKQIWFLMLIIMVLPSFNNINTVLPSSKSHETITQSVIKSQPEFNNNFNNYLNNNQFDMANELDINKNIALNLEDDKDSDYLTSKDLNSKIDEIFNLKDLYKKNDIRYDNKLADPLPYLDNQITTPPQPSQIVSDAIIVKFSSMDEQVSFGSQIPKEDILFQSQLIPYISIRTTDSSYYHLHDYPGIVDIFDDILTPLPDYIINSKFQDSDNISFYNSEQHIGAPVLHDMGITGKGVKVAVLDTGIDNTHHDLQYTTQGKTKIIGEASFVDYNFDGIPDEGPEDLIGHGTHVTGTVAGNGYQIGVAPGAYILNGKVCGSIGCATTWMMEAVEWAYFQKADIITMSIGGSTIYGHDPLDALIEAVWGKGVLFTIAAGNAGPSLSTVESPGVNPHVLTVGATDIYDKVTGFSGRGPSVYGHPDPDIVAPGENIFSTVPGNTYDIYSGTSMATPHVAGAAALLKQKFPYANPDMIKANLMKNAKDIGQSTNDQGMGLVDLPKTVKNWNRDSGLIFPQFTDNDVLYLSPGESFSGYLEFITGIKPHFSPYFFIPKEFRQYIQIDMSGNSIFSRQKYYLYTITLPMDIEPGESITISAIAWWFNNPSMRNNYFYSKIDMNSLYFSWTQNYFMANLFDHLITKINLNIQIEVIDSQNDANTNTDAGDTFPGATFIELGNYTAFANDIDFYKVYLNQGEQYTFILDGMTGYSDFDLMVYNSSGFLTCDICQIAIGGTSPELISLTAEYDGFYTIRVDPWSVLYLDPYLRFDSSGPYSLTMIIGTGESGGTGGTGTQLNYVSANLYGVDTDTDSIYDFLAIDITIDVTQTGLLDAYVWLALDKGLPLERTTYTMAYLERIELTTTGVQTLTFYVDGTLVADQHFTGSQIIYELFFGDPSTLTILHDLFNVYTSQVLDSNDFGPRHIEYQGFEISTIDENDDEISDWLVLNVSLQVLETFNAPSAYFYGVLWHPSGYYVYSVNTPELIISKSGQYYLEFFFNPNDFIGTVPELLELEFVVMYSSNHPLSIYTQDYGSFPYALMINEDFIVDTSEFLGSQSVYGDKIISVDDYGLDTNDNHKFDRLVFTITFQIVNPGYYSISMHPWLWSIIDQKVSFNYNTNGDINWYDSGTYTFEICVSGGKLNAEKLNGPFLVLYLYLDKYEYDPYNGYYYFVQTSDYYQNYLSHKYKYTIFESANLKFTNIIGVNYIDQNYDGEAETIELILEFNVGNPGIYDVDLNLIDYPLRSYYGYGGYYSMIFTDTGLQDVSFLLAGQGFYDMKFVGYLEIYSLSIYSQSDYSEIFSSYQNGVFWVDYNLLPGAAPSGAILTMSDFGEDSDSNGLYEKLILEINIDIHRPDTFFLYTAVYADPLTGYYTFIGSYYVQFSSGDKGILTIDLEVPAKDILNNAQDYYTNFEVWLYLYDGLGYQLDYKGPLYTNYYYLDEFEYIQPSYEWFTNFKEIDGDNDGLIDVLQLGVDFHSIDITDSQVDVVMEIYYIDEGQENFIDYLMQSMYVSYPDSWQSLYFDYLAPLAGDYHIITLLYIDGYLTDSVDLYWLSVDKFDLPTYSIDASLTSADWDFDTTDDSVEFNGKLHVYDNPGILEMYYYVYMTIYIFNEEFNSWDFYDFDYDGYYSYFSGDRVFSGYFFWNAKETGTFRFDIQITLYQQEIFSFSEIFDLNQFEDPFVYGYSWYYNYMDTDYDSSPDTIQFSYNAYVDPQMNVFDNLIFMMDLYTYDPATETKTYLETQYVYFPGPIMGGYWADFTMTIETDGNYYYMVNVSLDAWKVGQIELSTPYLTEKKEPDFSWVLSYFGSDTDGDSLEDTITINIDFTFAGTANYKVDVWIDIFYLDEEAGQLIWLDYLEDIFIVENGNPSTYNANFKWQAIYEGLFYFAINFNLNGQIFDYTTFSWQGAPISAP